MHNDDQLLAEQIALEREQIRKGLDKLSDNTDKLQDKSYASATVYGNYGIQSKLPAVISCIDSTRTRLARGQNGPAFREIRKHTDDLESLALASIAMKVTFDRVFSTKPNSAQVISVTEGIGRSVQDECQMRHYEREAPGLLNYLQKKYWHSAMGTHQKLANTRKAMNKADVPPWESWARGNNIKIGSWLLEQVMTATSWFTIELQRNGRRTNQFVVPTDEFMKMRDTIMHDAELFSPLAWPMLVPPRDWTPENQGGYILNEVMCGHEMVRRGNPTRIQGETIFEFINKIQKVPYKLNPFIVDVALQLEEKGIQVGKFIPISEMPQPPKPADIAENKESRKNYRRRAAEVLNKQAQETRKSCRTRMTMEAVKKFKDRDRFYIPWSFDYRGRAYPIPAFLTPQDTDFGKSLIKFADEADVTPESYKWLAF